MNRARPATGAEGSGSTTELRRRPSARGVRRRAIRDSAGRDERDTKHAARPSRSSSSAGRPRSRRRRSRGGRGLQPTHDESVPNCAGGEAHIVDGGDGRRLDTGGACRIEESGGAARNGSSRSSTPAATAASSFSSSRSSSETRVTQLLLRRGSRAYSVSASSSRVVVEDDRLTPPGPIVGYAQSQLVDDRRRERYPPRGRRPPAFGRALRAPVSRDAASRASTTAESRHAKRSPPSRPGGRAVNAATRRGSPGMLGGERVRRRVPCGEPIQAATIQTKKRRRPVPPNC